MSEPNEKQESPTDAAPLTEESPVVTDHSMQIAGRKLEYTVTAGRMPLRDAKGEIEAQMFYMAYTKSGDGDPAQRPLMFSFNGGPGSPSLWLHFGALGPKKVHLLEDGQMPAPPYRLVDNPHTWLEHTDLVFIDPVGTGYSRARTPEISERMWGVQGDIESVAEFIRMYLARNMRWTSPLFIVGESYGTTRAAGLSSYLVDRGIAMNGIVLVSSILNFQTARFFKGNDLPYVLFLPTYTATAFYHGKLDKRLSQDLKSTLKAVEAFAMGEYSEALAKGDRLTDRERSRVRAKLCQFTGLKREFVENRELRIEIHSFCKELLRDRKRTVGRLDSRFIGIDELAAREKPEHDPSMSAIMPPFTSTANQYMRQELKYESDLVYHVFKGIEKPWNWGSAGEGYPDTSESLRSAMSKNPYMKIYVASGYYDLATPYFATEYTLSHMGLDPSLRANIATGEYEAGHMMYIHSPCLEQLKGDIGRFIESNSGA